MGNGYLRSIQTIADDQTEVADKLQTLIDDNGVDSAEVKSISITPFGALKFLIVLAYASFREVIRFSTSLGLTATVTIGLRTYNRALSATLGLKTPVLSRILRTKYAFTGVTEGAKFGLSVAAFTKRSGTSLSTKVGLTASSPTWHVPFVSRSLTTSCGLSATWSATLNGVEIEPLG